MGLVLAAYTETSFQEFILPQTDNINYPVVLDSTVFLLPEDVSVLFEVVGGKWRFIGVGDNVTMGKSGVQLGDHIKHGDLIRIRIQSVPVAIVVMESSMTLSRFRKYKITAPCSIEIGQKESCGICYNFFSMVSPLHAVIDINENGCEVTEHGENGVFVSHKRVFGTHKMSYSEPVDILGLQIIWLGDVLAVGSSNVEPVINSKWLKPFENPYADENAEQAGEPERIFRRSPRGSSKLHEDTIEIDPPPQLRKSEKRPLILTIGPSLTMAVPMLLGVGVSILGARMGGNSAGIYMYTGIVIAVMSALFATMWALINIGYTKKQEALTEKDRLTRYKAHLEGIDEEIASLYKENGDILREIYPSAEVCAEYSDKTPQLWNRNIGHSDFLFVRLGIGSMPFQTQIITQKKKFTMTDDDLTEEPGRIKSKYERLMDVPLGVDLLDKRQVGVIGGDIKEKILRVLAVQMASCNCYTEVKLVFMYDGSLQRNSTAWAFAKWLPHVWSEDKNTRFIAATAQEISEVCVTLSNVFRQRSGRGNSAYEKKRIQHKPHYVFFIEDAKLLEGEPIEKYLLSPDSDCGATAIFFADQVEGLPNSCIDIISSGDGFSGMYNAEEMLESRVEMKFDEISPETAEQFARRLANIKVLESEIGSEVPDSLTFLEMFGVQTFDELCVDDRWLKNRTFENMRVPIGRKSGGVDWYLDIHEKYHGPHGLIAGTTGSGKSETLQTYILSLAVNFSPYDVSFFVIDFKGGGMANLFENLPHLAGRISNLSGNQVRRAMVSITSENKRRQKIFNEYGVNHIDQYTRLFKSNEAAQPMPHLLIVIDEFAELKHEEPEFMRELISVAQVGRSLGVHLILATQKPGGGTVDDNIWSNAKFRICLRVQDRQDSQDMLHKPDAAYITQAGRGYMQVGNDEIFELFQSGWSGAEYEDDADYSKRELASLCSNTGRPLLVGNSYKTKRKEHNRKLWLLMLCKRSDKLEELSPDDCALKIIRELSEDNDDYPETAENVARLRNLISHWRENRPLSVNDDERLKKTVDEMTKGSLKLPERKSKTQLDALIAYLNALAKKEGYTGRFLMWQPVLPEVICLSDLNSEAPSFNGTSWPEPNRIWNLVAEVGKYDNPSVQEQGIFSISLSENGHLAVCGTVVSGKSTFLQTFIYSLVNRYSPEQLNLYILDYSSRMLGVFEGLCHVGGVVYEDNEDRASKLFTMLPRVLNQRKKKYEGGNYSQYVKVNGCTDPAIVVVIDNYVNFKEKTKNKHEETLINLARNGMNYGIYLLISSGGFGSAEIPNRIADHIRNTVCLEMGDKFKYVDVLKTMRFETLPETGVTGRGIAPIASSILEFQTALAFEAQDDYSRAEMMSEVFDKMNSAWDGKWARPIPEIPEKPTWEVFAVREDVLELFANPDFLPFAYNSEDASALSIDFRDTYCWIIAGKRRTGKTNTLKLIMRSAAKKRAEACVFEFTTSELENEAKLVSAEYVDSAEGIFEYFKGLTEIFKVRNQRKRELISSGASEDEIYAEMRKETPIILYIDNLYEFLDLAYNRPEGVGDITGFLRNMTERGKNHNIYIVACVNAEDVSRMDGRPAFEMMKAYRTGLWLGGEMEAQRLFDFGAIPFMNQKKKLKPGTGHVAPTAEKPPIEIIIPNARG